MAWLKVTTLHFVAGGVVFSAPCVFQLWHGTSDGSSKMAQPTPFIALALRDLRVSISFGFFWCVWLCLIQSAKKDSYICAVEEFLSIRCTRMPSTSVFVSCFPLFPYFGSIASSSVQCWLRCFHVVAALDVSSACDGRYSEHNCVFCQRSRLPLKVKVFFNETSNMILTCINNKISRFHKISGSQLDFIAFPVNGIFYWPCVRFILLLPLQSCVMARARCVEAAGKRKLLRSSAASAL